MKVIINNILPTPGNIAINLFELVFIRRDMWEIRSEKAKAETLNHEAIHSAQMRELLWIFFYIIYGIEWLVRVFIDGPQEARNKTSFEREAWDNEENLNYLKTRKHYAEWRK